VTIIERHLAGETLPQVAESLHLNFYTIRKWWRLYRKQGWAGIIPKPAGPPPTGPLSEFDPLVKYVALRLKREHPAWGMDMLLLHMSRRPSLASKTLPKRTALWSYLHRFYPRLMEHRRLRARRPLQTTPRVTGVHQCWQMDFKGDVTINGLGQVRPWNVCDEFTSAPLATHLYLVGPEHPDVTFRDIQANLRRAFTRWGLPDCLRMDRDPRWVGSTRLEWPGPLLLWLVGLKVTPLINRAHCPKDNAHIERGNRTWYEHVGLGAKCQELAELQTLTDCDLQDRRERLPSRNPNCAHQPPLKAHPELAQPRRPFDPHSEATLFDMQRVYTYLSQWEWQRKVDHTGCISLADINRQVSLNHIGQVVKVHFDATTTEFVACTMDGEELRRFTLPIISAEYILGITPGGT